MGEAKEEVKNYDLMSAVMICLGEKTDKNYGGLLKFLEVLLSDEKTAAAKKTILQNEFDVPMTQTLETEVYQMCNLSQGVMEKGLQKGLQKGYGQGREEERVASVRNLMQNLHMTAEEAMQALNIPQEDRDRIQKALANEQHAKAGTSGCTARPRFLYGAPGMGNNQVVKDHYALGSRKR